MAALTADKTTVSRLISVTARIPSAVIDAIGPAPATGRDRWIALSAAFQAPQAAQAQALLQDPAFLAAPSDQRFEMLLSFLTRPLGAQPKPDDTGRLRARGRTRYWSPPNGVRIARVAANDDAFVLTIDQRAAPAFGEFILNEMNNLYSAYTRARQD